MPEMSNLKNVIILCGTNNVCTGFPYDIAQCLIDIGVCFRDRSSKITIFISRDECYSVNRMLIKEINTLHSFNFIEQE